MGNPQRQHFLSQTIQRNFLAKGETLLWMYDRATKKYEPRTPYGIGWVRHLYSFSPETKEHRYELEKAISTLEDKAAPIFSKLREREDINESEHAIIAEFMSLQVYRTPDSLDTLKNLSIEGDEHILNTLKDQLLNMSPEEFSIWIKDYQKKKGIDLSDVTQDAIRELFNKATPRVVHTKESFLKEMVDSSDRLKGEFLKRKWIVLHSTASSSFISSDMTTMPMTDGVHPSIDIVGPATAGMALYFPFAQDSALTIRGVPGISISHQTLTKDRVRRLNRGVAKRGNQLYSHSKKLLESLVASEKLTIPAQPKAYNKELIKKVAQQASRESFNN
jgi:hypothetical protein